MESEAARHSNDAEYQLIGSRRQVLSYSTALLGVVGIVLVVSTFSSSLVETTSSVSGAEDKLLDDQVKLVTLASPSRPFIPSLPTHKTPRGYPPRLPVGPTTHFDLRPVAPIPATRIQSLPAAEEIRQLVTMAVASHNPEPLLMVAEDLKLVRQSIIDMLKTGIPVLKDSSKYLFELGGKGFRPALVLLIGRALVADKGLSHEQEQELFSKHRDVAEVAEMIHTASLIHDDIIDDSSTRRGELSVSAKFRNKVGVLSGDYLLARASVALALLRSIDAVIAISTSLENLVEGELMQIGKGFGSISYQGVGVGTPGLEVDLAVPELGECDDWMRHYLVKTYFKTASLFAQSARSVGFVSDSDPLLTRAAFDFGKNLGMSFQIVDDILDIVSSEEELGKPALSDMRSGQLTAPALIAAKYSPEVLDLITGGLKKEDEGKVLEILEKHKSIEKATELAEAYANAARRALDPLPDSPAKSALLVLCDMTLRRTS